MGDDKEEGERLGQEWDDKPAEDVARAFCDATKREAREQLSEDVPAILAALLRRILPALKGQKRSDDSQSVSEWEAGEEDAGEVEHVFRLRVCGRLVAILRRATASKVEEQDPSAIAAAPAALMLLGAGTSRPEGKGAVWRDEVRRQSGLRFIQRALRWQRKSYSLKHGLLLASLGFLRGEPFQASSELHALDAGPPLARLVREASGEHLQFLAAELLQILAEHALDDSDPARQGADGHALPSSSPASDFTPTSSFCEATAANANNTQGHYQRMHPSSPEGLRSDLFGAMLDEGAWDTAMEWAREHSPEKDEVSELVREAALEAITGVALSAHPAIKHWSGLERIVPTMVGVLERSLNDHMRALLTEQVALLCCGSSEGDLTDDRHRSFRHHLVSAGGVPVLCRVVLSPHSDHEALNALRVLVASFDTPGFMDAIPDGWVDSLASHSSRPEDFRRLSKHLLKKIRSVFLGG